MNNKRYCALNLLIQAKEWYSFYKLGIKSDYKTRLNLLAPISVSLLFSLEFFLKSLIVLLDKEKQEEKELIKFGHDFKKMINFINKFSDKDNELKNILELINRKLDYLININLIDLRYPPLYSIREYFTEHNNDLDFIFNKIDKYINNKYVPNK